MTRALSVALLLGLAGCKPDEPMTTETGTGGSSSSSTTSTSTTSTTSTTSGSASSTEATSTEGTTGEPTSTTDLTSGSGTSGSTEGPTDARCMMYCAQIMTNCTGKNAQYVSAETCAGVCATFRPGSDGDVSGNSFACRLYHTGAAGMDANTHCVHAGPSGGGACGEPCEGFCTIAGAICPTEWPDAPTCASECAGFDGSEPYDAGDVSGDTLACRLYHLTVAATDPAVHCAHTVAMSAPCV